MQKESIFHWIFIVCISFSYSMDLYGMDNNTMPVKNFFHSIRSLLPRELQKQILLSQAFWHLENTINFLGSQPILLVKPDEEYIKPIASIALYGDIVETKSQNARKTEWLTILWNLHTGKCIHIVKNLCKPWEMDGPVITNNNTAINVIYDTEVVTSDTLAIWDKQTNKRLREIQHETTISSLAIEDEVIAIGFYNGTVKIWDMKKDITQVIQLKETISSLALRDNKIIIGTKDGTIEIWDINPNPIVRWHKRGHAHKITSITIHADTLLTGSKDKNVKKWEIDTGELLHTLTGPNSHTNFITAIATNGDTIVTGSQDCTAKIWPLLLNLAGTPEDNPLLWIIFCTDILQLNLIARACELTQVGQELIIDLPKNLSIVEQNESPEQTDGRTYFTLPLRIREYVRNRLKIRKHTETAVEKIHVAYANNNCSLM